MAELITAGIDVGTSAVKIAIASVGAGGQERVLHTFRERLHRRQPERVSEIAFETSLRTTGIERRQIAYVASTGDGDAVGFRDGHFYGMTTHARGAAHLMPGCRTVVDVGALHARVLVVDERSRVLRSRMTSQCASGTGQFVENISRYLGVRLDEIGSLSVAAPRSEACSGICAVLAETDVINMVSRGVPIGEILRGIHESIGQRLVKLMRTVKAESPVALTGGLSADSGLVAAIQRSIAEDGASKLEVRTHAQSVFAGAIGAALWAAARHEKLRQRGELHA